MFGKEFFQNIFNEFPLKITVDWSKKPSPEKYLKVNTLLLVLLFFHSIDATFLEFDGTPLAVLGIHVSKRRVFERGKPDSYKLTSPNSKPTLLIKVKDMFFKLYFEHCLYIDTEAGLKEYFPFSTIVLIGSGRGGKNPPDFEDFLIIETVPSQLSTKMRRRFKGFKYFPCPNKYALINPYLPKAELQFLKNNSFKVIYIDDSIREKVFTILEGFISNMR